ncbi:MAG: hypothetical protein K9H48_19670 [Melioribacteraceae bacterium]|nr:hypothetical protein [Candidatus Pacearchaeota archaeon]MCF8356669.1 hypothetical protein [Melioribacteraceae bacterium]
MSEYNAFHTSGSATLVIDNNLNDFIKDNLIDIEVDKNKKKYVLIFKTDQIPEKIEDINGFDEIDENKVIFDYYTEVVKNTDAISVMNNIKKILKTDNHVKEHPVKYYEDIMTHLLNVGTPYSSFIEVMLCNMFLSDKDTKEFWRYNCDKKAVKKFGDKNLAINLSSTLGCLYQPNKNTLQNIGSFEDLNIDNLSIHEKLWIGKYD